LINLCEMQIGIFSKRRCPNEAISVCSNCGRSFCREHIDVTPNGLICKACMRQTDETGSTYIAYGSGTTDFDDSDSEAFERRSDDPYADLS